MDWSVREERGLLEGLVGDGRPFLVVVAVSLIFAGGFALFLSALGQFLPHDIEFLGMSPEDLCRFQGCRIVRFMIHDRVAWGGALIAIGMLYLWLIAFPLSAGEAWAWWLFVVSGVVGFGSFLTYLGYGYLDSWHGVGTLLLLPFFVVGLARSRSLIGTSGMRSLVHAGGPLHWRSSFGVGRALLLAASAGMILVGLTIMTVGITSVFVPQDLQFMKLSSSDLHGINSRLVPLLAHDRAGFGGAICTAGVIAFFSVWCARPSRSLWQVLCCAAVVAFASALGVHIVVGYDDLSHLAPAMMGAVLVAAGLVLTFKPMMSPATGFSGSEKEGSRPQK